MNKPGKMAKGQYYKSGGKIGGQKEGDYEVGKKITTPAEVPYTYSGDPSSQIGKYAFNNGKISEQPVLDTRGFFGSIFEPNTANDINKRLALEKLTREELIPSILKEEEGRQGIITKSVLERLKQEQALQEPYQPVVNNFNSPGEVPFNYAGDPTELMQNRDRMPYVPINPKGVEGNLAHQTQLSNIDRQKAQEDLWKNQLRMQESELALREKEANAPKIINAGNSILKYDRSRDEFSEVGTAYPGDKGGEPIMTKDAKGNLVYQGITPPSHPSFKFAPRAVKTGVSPDIGAIGERPNYTPPMLQQSPIGMIGPASTQKNNFVHGEATRDGVKVERPGPLGGAPAVDPEKEATGYIPSMLRSVQGFGTMLDDAVTSGKNILQSLPDAMYDKGIDTVEKFYRPAGGFERPALKYDPTPLPLPPKKKDNPASDNPVSEMSEDEQINNYLSGMSESQMNELVKWLRENPDADLKRVEAVINFIKKERK